MSVAVLIPVLDRPNRVAPLLASLLATTRVVTAPRAVTGPIEADELLAMPLFLCNEDDAPQIAAVRAEGWSPVVVPWPATRGDYARKMNYGMRLARANGDDWVFLAADDLRFHPGWLEAALACHAETDACVVGTNDLGNARVTSGHHSTHSLVHLDYLECGTADEAGIVLHEGYWHNFVDDELVGTAKDRATWAVAETSRVEHLHPNWGKAGLDSTYAKGLDKFAEDRALFDRRRHLWGG